MFFFFQLALCCTALPYCSRAITIRNSVCALSLFTVTLFQGTAISEITSISVKWRLVVCLLKLPCRNCFPWCVCMHVYACLYSGILDKNDCLFWGATLFLPFLFSLTLIYSVLWAVCAWVDDCNISSGRKQMRLGSSKADLFAERWVTKEMCWKNTLLLCTLECYIIYSCSLQSVWGSARWWGVKLTPMACSYRQRPELRIDGSVLWVTVSAEESETVSSLFLHSFNRSALAGCDEDGADANVWSLKLFDFWVDGVKPMKCCERLRADSILSFSKYPQFPFFFFLPYLQIWLHSVAAWSVLCLTDTDNF